MSYNILQCPTISYNILKYPTISYNILRYPIISYIILRYPKISYNMLYCLILSYKILYCPRTSYIVLYCPMPLLLSQEMNLPSMYGGLYIHKRGGPKLYMNMCNCIYITYSYFLQISLFCQRVGNCFIRLITCTCSCAALTCT